MLQLTLLLSIVFSSIALAQSPRPEKPNFMFIYADDLGWQDLGSYDVDDNGIFDTPYIDELAKEGALFWEGYSPACVCGPSRASVLTGKHPARVGLTGVGFGSPPKPKAASFRVIPPYIYCRLPKSHDTIAELLKDAGYYTGHAGKWHVSGKAYNSAQPGTQGFDFTRQNRGIHNLSAAAFNPNTFPRVPFGTSDADDEYQLDENGFAHDQTTQDALDFLTLAADRTDPFYCYFATYIVHGPHIARTESLLKKYAERMGYDYPLTGAEYYPPGQNNPYYAAMVERFDYSVRQIVEYLKETEDPRWPGHTLFENTYIFISSDNGGMEWASEYATDNFPLHHGKTSQAEGGIRVPYIIIGPGISAGVESDVIINNYDAVPTMLTLAGQPLPTDIDGCDLTEFLLTDPNDASLIKHQDGSVRDHMVWHAPSTTYTSSIRSDRWKLIYHYDHVDHPAVDEFKLCEIYDEHGNPKDINESINVADHYPETVNQLKTQLFLTLDEMGATMPYRNPNCSFTLTNEELVPAVTGHGKSGEATAWVEFEVEGKAAITDASLIYALDGNSNNPEWFIAPASVVDTDRVEAAIPEGTTHYFFNLVDENNYLVSYPYIAPKLPNDGVKDSHYAIINE